MTYDYRTGDVVKLTNVWGVVKRMGPYGRPVVDWWVGENQPHRVGEWHTSHFVVNTGATYAVDDPHIPDQVTARAMRIILTEEDQ